MYKVILYRNESGKCEIENYLSTLNKKQDKDSKIKFNKIIAYIDMLSEYGLNIGEPYIKHLDNDIWELRPLRDRILFGYLKDNIFILLSIFMKQTKKTPQYEIDRAKRYLKDFIRRRNKNE